MPYKIETKGKNYFVISKHSGEVKGRHKTKQEAKEQMKALYANVKDFKK